MRSLLKYTARHFFGHELVRIHNVEIMMLMHLSSTQVVFSYKARHIIQITPQYMCITAKNTPNHNAVYTLYHNKLSYWIGKYCVRIMLNDPNIYCTKCVV